ncbi:hypothetical protein KCK31_000648 [Clostridium perfringens]|nr:hypothetical protein [Clostridium perfringens]
MGRKLNVRENADNMYNIMEFTEGEYNIYVNISVYKNRERIKYIRNEKIYISNMPDYYNLNITWEDFGMRNYKKLGLYGYYSTGYNKFIYSEAGDCLTIETSDGINIVLDKA